MNPIHLTRAGRCLDNGGRDERVDDTPRYLCMVDVGVRLQPERLRDSGIFFKLIGRAKQKETRLFLTRLSSNRPPTLFSIYIYVCVYLMLNVMVRTC